MTTQMKTKTIDMTLRSSNLNVAVRFNPEVDSKEVPHANDLNKDALWYRTSEYGRIAASVRETLHKMSTSRAIDDDADDCTRGLECMTEEGRMRAKEMKQTVFDAVLDQQIDHWGDGGPNPEELASTYRTYTGSSVSEAISRGLEDERIAKRHVEEVLAMCQPRDRADTLEMSN